MYPLCSSSGPLPLQILVTPVSKSHSTPSKSQNIEYPSVILAGGFVLAKNPVMDACFCFLALGDETKVDAERFGMLRDNEKKVKRSRCVFILASLHSSALATKESSWTLRSGTVIALLQITLLTSPYNVISSSR
jgi:hypothetical protein